MAPANGSRLSQGTCACGSARFEMLSAPLVVHCCHCSACQRETGSAFAINALIETDRIRINRAALRRAVVPSASGAGQELVSCSACGTVLWSHYDYPRIGRRLAFVRVGTLGPASQLSPDVHIFVDGKRPWVQLDDQAPQFPRGYRPQEVWSADSLHRRSVLERSAQSQQAAL